MFTKQQEFKAMRNEMETIKQLRQHENIVQFLDINEQEVSMSIGIGPF